jgi:hypothetical protein
MKLRSLKEMHLATHLGFPDAVSNDNRIRKPAFALHTAPRMFIPQHFVLIVIFSLFSDPYCHTFFTAIVCACLISRISFLILYRQDTKS